MNDVVQAARRQRLTSLVAALHLDSVLLYIPRHVLIELERDLPAYAQKLKRPVDPAVAESCWRNWYAPCIRVVDVPLEWGAGDERVKAVTERHEPDAPTARLAVALADCYVITRDGDLTKNQFGVHEHLPLLHAAGNQGEKNYVDQMAGLPVALGAALLQGSAKGFHRLPLAVQASLGLAAAAAVYRWQRSGRARQDLHRLARAAGVALETIGPPLQQLSERLRDSEEVWQEHLFTACEPRSITEQVARILAFAPDEGMLARDIADELDIPGSVKARTTAVRASLENSEAFTEVTPWRWRLGEPVINQPAGLPTEMLADWIARAHRIPFQTQRAMPDNEDGRSTAAKRRHEIEFRRREDGARSSSNGDASAEADQP
ncbi:hypothetical protein AB0283_04190 [Micromonospora vinacea]|uniref:hypothetical protein n=1 Tax=Micromonospora vinacea TaxID=709878 RepID=UPI00344E82D4